MYYYNGNVGIGTSTPAQKLSVVGTIESTTGGIKFPDATIQTSAASAASDTRFKLGAFTRDQALAAGTQVITGVGFQPKAIIFLLTVTILAATLPAKQVRDIARQQMLMLH